MLRLDDEIRLQRLDDAHDSLVVHVQGRGEIVRVLDDPLLIQRLLTHRLSSASTLSNVLSRLSDIPPTNNEQCKYLDLSSVLQLSRSVSRSVSLNLQPDVETDDGTNNDNNDDHNNDNNDSHVVLGLRLVENGVSLVAHIGHIVVNQISESLSVVVVILQVLSEIGILSAVSNTEVEHVRQLLGQVDTDLNNGVLIITHSTHKYVRGTGAVANVTQSDGTLLNSIELLQTHLNSLRFRLDTNRSGVGNQIVVINEGISLFRVQRHAVLRVHSTPGLIIASTVHLAPIVARASETSGNAILSTSPFTISGASSKNTNGQH